MEEVWVSFGLGRALEALRATKPKIMHVELQPRDRAFGQSLRRFRQVPPPLEYVQEYLPHQETKPMSTQPEANGVHVRVTVHSFWLCMLGFWEGVLLI